NVRAGAEHPLLAAGYHHAARFRMFEADALQGVRELDVDPEIVRIELELVARDKPSILIDVQSQHCHWTLEPKLPVRVTFRMGIVGEKALFLGRTLALRRGDCLQHGMLLRFAPVTPAPLDAVSEGSVGDLRPRCPASRRPYGTTARVPQGCV